MSLARAGLGVRLATSLGCRGTSKCSLPSLLSPAPGLAASRELSYGAQVRSIAGIVPLRRPYSTAPGRIGILPPARLISPATPLHLLQKASRLPHSLPRARFASSAAVSNRQEFSSRDDRDEHDDVARSQASSRQGDANGQFVSDPAVAYHLFFCAALVYLIIVVGGLTRLTESGLSITEWNPGFKGMRLPLTDAQWDEEWEKYKTSPEWAVLNRHMTVADFKKIYMWEWSHRIIGRVIGVAYILPAFYFLARGRVAQGSRWKIWAIAAGIGFQGALGWFMVKSGLTAPDETPPVVAPTHPNATVAADSSSPRVDGSVSSQGQASTQADWHPRVSHFRLAAHLGTAFAVYLGMLHTGMSMMRDYRFATETGRISGADAKSTGKRFKTTLSSPQVARFRATSRAVFALTFVTAMTGALVAGLDAGLVYSEFPYMGEGIVPPRSELLDERYALGKGKSPEEGSFALESKPSARLILGNFSQNPVSVQFMHRCLAVTTLASALGLAVYSRGLARALSSRSKPAGQSFLQWRCTKNLPPYIPRVALGVAGMATLQATLGISTLIYLVPLELASAHQAGSVALLSSLVALLVSMRRPSSAAYFFKMKRVREKRLEAKVRSRAAARTPHKDDATLAH